MSKISNACGISPAVRQEVYERDGRACIICGSYEGIQVAHYISRARLGKGNARNLACMCISCHMDYDNGKLHREIKNAFKEYLQAKYDDWDEKALVYRK